MTPTCIKCGDENATVTIDAADGDTIRCAGCEAEYTVDDVEALIEAWKPVLAWCRLHPARTAEPVTA